MAQHGIVSNLKKPTYVPDDETMKMIENLFLSGNSRTTIAQITGISEPVVDRLIKEAKLTRPRIQTSAPAVEDFGIDAEKIERIQKLIDSGLTKKVIALKVGVSLHILRRTIEEYGIVEKKNETKELTDDDMNTIRELASQGQSQVQIAKLIGISRKRISKIFDDEGLKRNQSGRPKRTLEETGADDDTIQEVKDLIDRGLSVNRIKKLTNLQRYTLERIVEECEIEYTKRNKPQPVVVRDNRDKIILKMRPLVLYLARQLSSLNNIDEAIAFGWQGLIYAVDHSSLDTRTKSFDSYASKCIKGHIIHGMYHGKKHSEKPVEYTTENIAMGGRIPEPADFRGATPDVECIRKEVWTEIEKYITPEQYQYIYASFVLELTTAEICERFQVTRHVLHYAIETGLQNILDRVPNLVSLLED